MAFTMLRYVPSIQFDESLLFFFWIMNGYWILSTAFSDRVIFILFIIVVYHIDWLADIEPFLHHFAYVNIDTKFKWIFPRLSSILRNQCRSSWSVEYILLFPVISSCYLISVNNLVTLHNQTWNLIVIVNISILFSHPWYLLVVWYFLSLLLCLLNPIPLHCISEKYKFHFFQQYSTLPTLLHCQLWTLSILKGDHWQINPLLKFKQSLVLNLIIIVAF